MYYVIHARTEPEYGDHELYASSYNTYLDADDDDDALERAGLSGSPIRAKYEDCEFGHVELWVTETYYLPTFEVLEDERIRFNESVLRIQSPR